MDNLAPRIIAFGCSYTSYIYPTFADILQSVNYGWSGSGNEKIFYTLLDKHKTGELKAYDVVLLQWSSAYRFDYLTAKGWSESDGNISKSTKNKHIWNNIKGWYNPIYEKEKTINYMIAAHHLLQSYNVRTITLSMNDFKNSFTKIDYNNLLDAYQGNYKFKHFTDWHPSISQHLELATNIANTLNIKINSQVAKKAIELHKEIGNTGEFKEYKL